MRTFGSVVHNLKISVWATYDKTFGLSAHNMADDHTQAFLAPYYRENSILQPVFSYLDDPPKKVKFQVMKNDFWKLCSHFFPLKSIVEVTQRTKMQFSPIHTHSGGMQNILKFQWPDQRNSISLVLEKSAKSMELVIDGKSIVTNLIVLIPWRIR